MAKNHIPQIFESEFEEIKKGVQEKVAELIENTANNDAIRSMDTHKMEKFLKKFIREHPFIQLITVTDSEGKRLLQNITQVEEKHKFTEFKTEDFYDRPWFFDTVKTGKTYVSNFYSSKITDDLCITVATPVMDKNEKEIKGVLEFDIKFEDAAKF